MFRLSSMIRQLAIVSLLILLLGVFNGLLLAQEAPRDSGTLIKPPTIKPPTSRSQATNRGTIRSRSRSRRGRRTTRRVVRRAATAKPRGVVGVSVDPTTDVPERVTDTPPASAATATTPKPKRPISGGVLNGRAVSLPVPVYSPIAKAARASGTVVVQVMVDERGDVISTRVLSGHRLLREAAEEAARNAKFTPTIISGQPVKITGVVTYKFDNE